MLILDFDSINSHFNSINSSYKYVSIELDLLPSINNKEHFICLLLQTMKQTKLNLPFHSKHRHNVHKQRGCVCTWCYRYVDRQGQQAVIHKGGKLPQG